MRVLVVSQMYPGSDDPDLGVFVAQVVRELHAQGHRLELAVIRHRGGSRTKYLRLALDAVVRARRGRPDVVYAHFLAPAGSVAAVAALVARAPLVLTAHGTDVANIGTLPGIRLLTRLTVRRAEAVIAVSDWLRRRLEAALPELAGRVEVVDCGVDLERFAPRDARAARRRVDWAGQGPFFLCVGSLIERKNVVRLVEALGRLGRGQLALVGDGPLRGELERHPRVRVVGRVAHEEVADWIAAADVLCQPALSEAFGQSLLEAMACERSVLATANGGPPEFVPPAAGVLVDPEDVSSIADGLRTAAALPVPNPAARRAAAEHDVRRQAGRIAAILERARGGAG